MTRSQRTYAAVHAKTLRDGENVHIVTGRNREGRAVSFTGCPHDVLATAKDFVRNGFTEVALNGNGRCMRAEEILNSKF